MPDKIHLLRVDAMTKEVSFIEAEAEQVHLVDYVDTFIYRVGSPPRWAIAEGRSGACMGVGSNKRDVMADVKRKIAEFGKENMEASIQAWVDMYGLSPSYEGERDVAD